jgi:hypothetical protein
MAFDETLATSLSLLLPTLHIQISFHLFTDSLLGWLLAASPFWFCSLALTASISPQQSAYKIRKTIQFVHNFIGTNRLTCTLTKLSNIPFLRYPPNHAYCQLALDSHFYSTLRCTFSITHPLRYRISS